MYLNGCLFNFLQKVPQERETFENWERNDAIQDDGDLEEDRRDDGNKQLVYDPVSWGEIP